MKTAVKDRKVILSTLWIFVLFNYVYCDMLGLMDASILKQYLNGVVQGMQISQEFLLFGAILMEIPIAMVLLSRVLNYKANRWVNITAAAIKTIVIVCTLFLGTPTFYYIFFASIEIATTLFIFYYAWTWKEKIGEVVE